MEAPDTKGCVSAGDVRLTEPGGHVRMSHMGSFVEYRLAGNDRYGFGLWGASGDTRVYAASKSLNSTIRLCFSTDDGENFDDAIVARQGSIELKKPLTVDHVNVGNVTANYVHATSDVITYSDARLKTNLVKIENALDKVSRLEGYTFTRTGFGESTGLIAQDVREVLPQATLEDENGYLSVSYGGLVGLLVNATNELRELLQGLRRDVDALNT